MNWRSRAFSAFALLSAGLMIVHQLRYSFGVGGSAAGAVGVHQYLAFLEPALGMTLLAAVAFFARRVHRASTGRLDDAIPQLRFLPAWATASGILIGAFFLQETAEGLIAGSGGNGPASLLGHDGWIAPLAAVIVGAVIAFLLRAADAVITRVCRAHSPRAARAPLVTAFGPLAPLPRLRSVVAENLAGRAPPLTA